MRTYTLTKYGYDGRQLGPTKLVKATDKLDLNNRHIREAMDNFRVARVLTNDVTQDILQEERR